MAPTFLGNFLILFIQDPVHNERMGFRVDGSEGRKLNEILILGWTLIDSIQSNISTLGFVNLPKTNKSTVYSGLPHGTRKNEAKHVRNQRNRARCPPRLTVRYSVCAVIRLEFLVIVRLPSPIGDF